MIDRTFLLTLRGTLVILLSRLDGKSRNRDTDDLRRAACALRRVLDRLLGKLPTS